METTRSTASDFSNSTVADRQTNIRMVEEVILIWLDSNIDVDNSVDCCNTIKELRRVVNNINMFTDDDECIEFIKSMNNEKACMIISGSLGRHVVPYIHNMSQVDSIFIFCGNKKRYEQWAQEWSKIKGIFTEISPICEALKQVAPQLDKDAISISFVSTEGDVSRKKLNQLDSSFIYTQILKEILSTMKFEEKHIKQFIDYCRHVFADNKKELVNIKELETKYHDKTPIWWYTYQCFLYPMLNRALRLMEVDIIIKIGFFISDLHHHIEQLHSEQLNDDHSCNSLTVYRGQGLSKTDFDQLTKTKGGLLSFNTFLSTSKNRAVSLDFARHTVKKTDLVGILFVMMIDPSKSTTPFASITDVSFYENVEDEILFSMHTVFRICDIKPMDENNRLFQVDLMLTSDNDKDLCVLTNRIRKGTFLDAMGWDRLGLFLLRMGQSHKAQQMYEGLLEHTTNEFEKGFMYDQIGWAKEMQGEYKEAIIFLTKSLEIFQKTMPPYHPTLASCYTNMGVAYSGMGEYSKALLSYKKALKIRQQTLCPNHPSLATSYNGIGAMYCKLDEYSKALPFFECALDIGQRSLPSNHPELLGYRKNLDLVKKNL
jgi:hypothetical protein